MSSCQRVRYVHNKRLQQLSSLYKDKMQLKASLLALLPSLALVAARDPQESLKADNDTLLWGPYRPNLYFGVRPRIPKSLLTGLMWTNVDDFAGAQNSEILSHSQQCTDSGRF